jgi:hypothetical protein
MCCAAAGHLASRQVLACNLADEMLRASHLRAM